MFSSEFYCNHFFLAAREKRSVLGQKVLSIGFQDFYDDVDREKREVDLEETPEEIELRSYGSHLRFSD